jgi:biotin carboxyl carrier protein
VSEDERRYYAGEIGRGGSVREVVVSDGGEEAPRRANVGGAKATVRVLPGGGRFLVTLHGRSVVGFAVRRDGDWHIELEGRAYRVRVDDERTHELRALTAEMGPGDVVQELRAPMPGLVVRVAVQPGDSVSQGDPLVVMEAMKMENELQAEVAGVVGEVHVREGTTVDRDDVLVTFELEST